MLNHSTELLFLTSEAVKDFAAFPISKAHAKYHPVCMVRCYHARVHSYNIHSVKTFTGTIRQDSTHKAETAKL